VLRRRLIALVLVLAIGVALAVSALVWAKSYAPLRVTAYGPGFGFSSGPYAEAGEPCFDYRPGGCAQLLFVARDAGTRIAEMHLVVTNSGRWPITIERTVVPYDCTQVVGHCFAPQELRRPPTMNANGQALSTRAFRPLRVEGHASADLWVRFRGRCLPSQQGVRTRFALPLVYHYLRVFERTQRVLWPFWVTSAC
jgi:hypothetical protein